MAVFEACLTFHGIRRGEVIEIPDDDVENWTKFVERGWLRPADLDPVSLAAPTPPEIRIDPASGDVVVDEPSSEGPGAPGSVAESDVGDVAAGSPDDVDPVPEDGSDAVEGDER